MEFRLIFKTRELRFQAVRLRTLYSLTVRERQLREIEDEHRRCVDHSIVALKADDLEEPRNNFFFSFPSRMSGNCLTKKGTSCQDIGSVVY